MITMINVFATTFEFFTAPGAVQFRMRQIAAKWGTSLDATAPVTIRVEVLRAMRKWGIPGTPIGA